ncbi:transcription-repair coupling factor [Bacteroides sp. An19]|uniref:transcription-repair coupling factor n=1 Tax=Bacteroides sp. An19 TaxID=1965580 RepID=UPI000B3A7E5A|nr:transcription-repair coupling factor [Bacteroides sp. An19]OUP29927.1 transcription-repair coupling factor [Bacteroides sp. An19]
MKKSAFIKKIAEAVIESIREEHFEIPYLRQIAAAQEYLNANRNADLSHVKCLLRWIMPKEYHDEIDKLHEREDPKFVCIINGGQNLIAPNARQAEQTIQDSIPEK